MTAQLNAAQFKSNGSPHFRAAGIARDLASQCVASRAAILEQMGTLSVRGVTTFQTKNVADAGGKTSIFVERIS